ncbi:MAG: hypothetical protein ACJ8C4_16340 [Gemmataceae bacterium]
METLIASPKEWEQNMTPRAYCRLDDGKLIGPIWPYAPTGLLPFQHIQTGPLNMSAGNLDAVVRTINPYALIEKPTLNAGEYYPRMWRGDRKRIEAGDIVPEISQTPFFDSFMFSVEQVESLFETLDSIFRVAHPMTANLGTCGGAIRDIIILASTEVESQWKSVLTANRFFTADGRYTTAHYVRLLPALKLDEYSICLIRYPSLPEFSPFKGWDVAAPTQTLPWYDAYNAVKHDREGNFWRASLEAAVHSVAACVVMLAAQFGQETLSGYGLRNIFQFTKTASYDPRDFYYGPIPETKWKTVEYPF